MTFLFILKYLHSEGSHLPKVEIIPQRSHAMREKPTEPAPSVTPVGEMNIPEPKTVTKYQSLETL